jgi:glutaconyl-CoA/methylmalonyl-CoA decarboxylase subunit gamma
MKRDLIVTADGRERTVSVEGPTSDGTFQVTIDGALRIVDGRAIRPGTWSLVIRERGDGGRVEAGAGEGAADIARASGEVIQGQSFVVDLDQRRTGIHASVGASEATLQVEDALRRRLSQAAGGGRASTQRGESIRAPIAGKVVKVLVTQGDQVEAGKPVIVLEAMKMENELVAERGGTVAAIHKAAGQAVDTGDLLVELT